MTPIHAPAALAAAGIPGFVIPVIVAVLALVAGLLWASRHDAPRELPQEREAPSPEPDGGDLAADFDEAAPEDAAGAPETIVAPLAGTAIPMADVPDPVFSSEAMGRGAAIEPTDGTVVSPVTGIVTMVFETGHAVELRSDAGAEVLVHVGIDTVRMGAAPFDVRVATGDRVQAGQVLMHADLDAIRAAGYRAVTPVVVTNSESYASVRGTTGPVGAGDALIEVA